MSLDLNLLICEGYSISIEMGKLKIIDPQGFIKNFGQNDNTSMVIEILRLLGIDGLIYESYSTGNYNNNKSSGVTLRFRSLISGVEPYAIFNVELTRARTTPAGTKGTLLPGNQFRVGKRSLFYKFWASAGLKFPARLSSFYDYMGNLKNIVFIAEYSKGNKLSNSTIKPLEVTHTQLLTALECSESPYNNHTNDIHQPNNFRTNLPYKSPSKSQAVKGFQEYETTRNCNCDISNQDDAMLSELLPDYIEPYKAITKSPLEQTNEEWLEEYEKSDVRLN